MKKISRPAFDREDAGNVTARVEPGNVKSPLRPALIVGLGGTGHRLAVHLKATFVRAVGQAPPERVRILAFDTADESIAVALGDQSVALETDRELFNIGHTPVGSILRNLDRQPAIAARLPSLHALPPVMLRAGAKQVRPLGLLALLWRFDEVERRLKTAIWELAGKETLGREAGVAQGINVFICFSLVGGTGSGTFLDMAYLVRDLFDELGTLGDFCYITGVAVLPQAFRGISGPNLIPNTVAALRELGHCMIQGGFACSYSNGRRVETRQPPFDLVYLLDGVDEQGYVWRGLDTLCDMAATGLYLQIGSQVGRKGENAFDNLDEVLGGQTDDGEGTFCGSFGMAILRFDARRVADWCAARLARQMVAEGLLGPADRAAARERAGAWVRAQTLSPEALLAALARDDAGIPLAVDLRPPGWVRRGRDARVPQGAVRYLCDYERVRLRGAFHTWLKANQVALGARLTQALERSVSAALSDEPHGVSAALAFCRALDARLERIERALESARAAAQTDRSRLEAELAAREETLLRAAGANLLLRGRAVAAARDRYFQTANACLNQAWQEALAQGAIALLAALRRSLGEWTAAFNGLRVRLEGVGRTLGERAATLSFTPGGAGRAAVMDLADPAYCRRLYAAHAPPLAQVLSRLAEEEALESWPDLKAGEIAARLTAVAREAFEAVAVLTVEQVIADRTGEASPAARKERLFRLATPSWNLDLTRLRDGGTGLRGIQVLGVADESDSLFGKEMRLLVSIHDPTTVVAFLATIGAPFTAIQQYPDYLRRYETVRRLRPLHVLPQFQADGKQSKLAFALGTIFDLIVGKGAYFYYRPADPLDPPVKLEQGLSNALRRFARTDSLVQDVLDRVERQIEEIGTAAAVERLAAYYARPPGGERNSPDGLLIEMRKLVRAYTDQLRATLQAIG